MDERQLIKRILTSLMEAGAQVPELDSSYPLEEPEFGLPARPKALADLEQLLGAPLPSDYRAFLESCDSISAMDVFNGYHIYAPVLVCRQLKASDVPIRLLLSGGATPAIPVAGDGGGNQFLLAVTGKALWKWSHEFGPVDRGVLDARRRVQGLTMVAPSFTAFLQRVLEDWQHFLSDDRSWKYLSG